MTAADFADTASGAAQLLDRMGIDGKKLQSLAIYPREYEEDEDNDIAACVWFIAKIPSFMQDAAPIFRMAGNNVVAFAKAGIAGSAGGSDAQSTSGGSTQFVDFAKHVGDTAKQARSAQGKIKDLTGIGGKLRSKFRTGRAAAHGFASYRMFKALQGTDNEEMLALSSHFLIGGVTIIESIASGGILSVVTRYYISKSTFAEVVDHAARVGGEWMSESLTDYAQSLMDTQSRQYFYDTDDNTLEASAA